MSPHRPSASLSDPVLGHGCRKSASFSLLCSLPREPRQEESGGQSLMDRVDQTAAHLSGSAGGSLDCTPPVVIRPFFPLCPRYSAQVFNKHLSVSFCSFGLVA